MLLTSPIDSSIVGVCSVNQHLHCCLLFYFTVHIGEYRLILLKSTIDYVYKLGPSSISQYTSMYIVYAHVYNVYGTTTVNRPILLYTLTRTALYYVDSQ